jgi:hypothetical protein
VKITRLGGVETYSITDFDVQEFPILKVRERFPEGFDRINVHYRGNYTPEKAYISQSWGDMESILLEDKESLAIVTSFILDYMQAEKAMGKSKN